MEDRQEYSQWLRTPEREYYDLERRSEIRDGASLTPELVEAFAGIVEKKVKNSGRGEKVRHAVRELLNKSAEDLVYDDEDFLLAIKEIQFFPENVIRAKLIDGSVQEMDLNPCWPNKERRRWK